VAQKEKLSQENLNYLKPFKNKNAPDIMVKMSCRRKTLTAPILLLALLLPAFSQLSTANFYADTVRFSDDFESYPVGSFPSQWTLVFDGLGEQYQQVIVDPVNSSNKCFRLQGEKNWAADAVRYFHSDSDVLGFEVSVLVTNVTGTAGDNIKVGFWQQVNWGQAKWNDGVAFTDNGSIVARDYVEAEGTGTSLGSYVPNQWYHICFILDRPNKLISVYIDGQLACESVRGSERGYIFDGVAVSGRYTENPVCYDNVQIFEGTDESVCEPTLTVQCASSAPASNFLVEVSGALTFNESGISGAPILLSYSVTGGKTWVDLALVQTRTDGCYYAQWHPTVTGCYTLKAVYGGNNEYSGTAAQVDFVVEPCSEQTVLSVCTNSTLLGFFFDSNSSRLCFTVSGDNGTAGYVKVNVPKSLIADSSKLAVYLDNVKVEYSLESQGENWVLCFTYHHSIHQVEVNLAEKAAFSDGFLGVYLAVAALAVAAGGLVVYFKLGKQKN
jgi:hypothetical protein